MNDPTVENNIAQLRQQLLQLQELRARAEAHHARQKTVLDEWSKMSNTQKKLALSDIRNHVFSANERRLAGLGVGLASGAIGGAAMGLGAAAIKRNMENVGRDSANPEK